MRIDQDQTQVVVDAAIEAGITLFDTADVYGGTKSEEFLGKALGKRRPDIVLATKFGMRIGDDDRRKGGSRRWIMRAVEDSLTRLGTDYIDLYQFHQPDPDTPIDETLRALDDLVSSDMVRYIGVSNWQAWRIEKALGVSERRGFARFETVQAYYSIAGRDLEREIVPMMAEEKLGLMVWSPLAGGLLSGKYGPGAPGNGEGRRANFDFPPVNKDRAWACVAAMRDVAAKHGASVAEVALAWILAKPFVTSIIIGAKRIEQLEQNLAAVKLQLDAEDMAKLDEVSALEAEYPTWMVPRQNAARVPQPFEPKG
jgi:aryl-alcohol dehydrogenase-like predicted oxidoreductase